MWYQRFPRYERKPTRQARGGIKAQSQRGNFGQSWWAKRWISVLESLSAELGGRLSRGRSYARNGQVLDIDIKQGRVTAQVQGSHPTPYKISIEVKPIPEPGWKEVVAALSRQAIFAAKLIAGEMPQDIEQPFAECKVPLLPDTANDLKTSCSCPDWSNPCKHVAAVYYLIGEEFDRDPFLIFRLRGMDRQQLLEQLSGSTQFPADTTAPTTPSPSEPLPAEPALFWSTASPAPRDLGSVEPPPVAAALPKRLGSFPFCALKNDFSTPWKKYISRRQSTRCASPRVISLLRPAHYPLTNHGSPSSKDGVWSIPAGLCFSMSALLSRHGLHRSHP